MMLVFKPKLRGKVGVKSGVKSTLYAAYSGLLPDPGVISIGEKLRDIRPQPGICKTLHGLEKLTMVESKFGPVPFGSVLSYQCPLEATREIIKHPNAPEFPQLPVEGYKFQADF